MSPETLYLLLRCFGKNVAIKDVLNATDSERAMVYQWMCSSLGWVDHVD